MSNIFKLKIAGEAGFGIKSAGLLFSKFASRSGYHIYNYIEYPSIIRGGHNVMQINISADSVTGPSIYTDLLIALNQQSIDNHFSELQENAGVIFDSDKKLNTSNIPSNVNQFGIPLSALAKQSGGSPLLSNVVALGAVVGLTGGDLKILKERIKEEYGDKKDEIVESDIKAAEAGYNHVIENYKDKLNTKLAKQQVVKPQMVINGDEAVALGAISAGLQFAAIYPMSPISGVLHTLVKHQEEFKFVYKQPEDEISAINMAIGASYAGARSMTVTSGGGFALMSEAYGLAGMTETPLVIVEGMRGSPATGIPTWSEQGDLRFVLHAHQGDFPRIILAAGDAIEAFYMTMEAFYIADRYQTPVVLLIDKNICDHDQTVPIFDVSSYKVDRGKLTTEFDENYKRYELSEDGISNRSIPGTGNFFIANSDEHDEFGLSNEEIDNRNAQMSKRMQKLETCAEKDMPKPHIFGPADADLTIVSWGSNKGPILQAMQKFSNVNYMHITWMNPFPSDFIKETLTNAKNVLHIEANYTGQLAGLIREKTGIEIKNKYLKNDGRPFFIEELEEQISKALKGAQ